MISFYYLLFIYIIFCRLLEIFWYVKIKIIVIYFKQSYFSRGDSNPGYSKWAETQDIIIKHLFTFLRFSDKLNVSSNRLRSQSVVPKNEQLIKCEQSFE